MATAHIESKLEDIADIVLMPGDPLRAKYIAEKFLDEYKLVNEVRNMYAYTGYYKNKKVTIFSSGMGIPSIGIYAYELYKFYDVKKIIRIGTAGSNNINIKLKNLVLSSGAFCKSYFPLLFDGVDVNFVSSSEELNKKIMDVAKDKNIYLQFGETITSDVFDPYCDDREKFCSNFPKRDFLATEMEAFGLFYIAKKLHKEASCLMTIVDSTFDKQSLSSEEREKSLDEMISLALDAIIL